ncbi:MAG TPA: hypothetical protein DD640_00615 [Clostridiales bacterium]|nr:hypothetical protein [Clostridiales bacterium]
MERPVARPQPKKHWAQPPTAVLPFREWLAVRDSCRGLAVAVKGLYEYEAEMDSRTGEPTLYLTLLRGIEYMSRTHVIDREGAVGSCFHTPGAQCLGRQVFEWAYIPYAVDHDNTTPFLPVVQSYLYPPATHLVRPDRTAARRSVRGAAVGQEWRPFVLISGDLQFSAFKRAYDEDGYILRYYENQGKAVQAVLLLDGFARAYRSNLNEEKLGEIELQNQVASLSVGPFKVLTLLLIGRI